MNKLNFDDLDSLSWDIVSIIAKGGSSTVYKASLPSGVLRLRLLLFVLHHLLLQKMRISPFFQLTFYLSSFSNKNQNHNPKNSI
jgi:hypothetical protein